MEQVVKHRREKMREAVRKARQWAMTLKPPCSVILVGSYARGDFNVWSDIDILIISPRFDKSNPVERLRSIDAPPGYEVIPWTPDELVKAFKKNNPLALEAIKYGIILRDDLNLKTTIDQLGRTKSQNHNANSRA